MMEYNGHKIWKLQILWGKRRGVVFVPSEQKVFLERGEIIILSMPENSTQKQREDFLKASLKKVLREQIQKQMPKWEQATGLKCSSWFIGKNKRAWGWCRQRDRKIMLNQNLVYKPKECLDYVILHELCHLAQANHGPNFAALLNQHMPNWRELEILNNGALPAYSKYE